MTGQAVGTVISRIFKMEIKKTWSELKSLLSLKKGSIQYETKYEQYKIWFTDNNETYFTRIEITDPAGTDQADFENNYKANANRPESPRASDTTPYVRVTEKTVGKYLQLKGFEIDCPGNDTSDLYVSWTEDVEFVGARAKIYDASTGNALGDFNDTADMQIVDKDNILGYGAGLVITEFGKDIPGKILEWGCVSETTTAAMVMTGLYIKISYINSTSTDKKLCGVLKYYH